MAYNSNPSELESKKYLQIIDKHIVGGSKRGRKPVDDKIFLKYKNNTNITRIDEDICKKMTLKQLRQTALYKKLHYDPKRKAGIKVSSVAELVEKLKNEAKVI